MARRAGLRCQGRWQAGGPGRQYQRVAPAPGQTLDALVLSDDEKYKSIMSRRSRNTRRHSGSIRATRSRPSGWSGTNSIRRRTRSRPRGSWTSCWRRNPSSIDVRLARYRFYTTGEEVRRGHRRDGRRRDPGAPPRRDPPTWRPRTPSGAITGGGPGPLRRHPRIGAGVPKFRMLLGMLEFSRGNHEKAIEHYRKGLGMSRGQRPGTHLLSRPLAHQAQPVGRGQAPVAQFQRLEGKEDRTGVALFLNALYDQRRAISLARSPTSRRPSPDPRRLQGRAPAHPRPLLPVAGRPRPGEDRLSEGDPVRRPGPRSPPRDRPAPAGHQSPGSRPEMERALAQSPNDCRCSTTRADSSSPARRPWPSHDRRWNRLEEILDKARQIALAISAS